MTKARILTAEFGPEGHDRGARLITRVLMEAGCEVICIDVRPTPEALVNAALQEDVDLVGVSTFSESDLALVPRVLELFRERQMSDVPVVVGGMVPDAGKPGATGVAAVFDTGSGAAEIARIVRDLIVAGADRNEERAMRLAERIAAGDHRALARAITLVENEEPGARELLRSLYRRTGHAHVCGITGPPGTGKSTLVQGLAIAFRLQKKQVAIVAVDPSSPFTGGALLGDRIRMGRALDDPGLFMRSLASRGHLGGLSVATADVIALLDAAGFEIILVETVGAGQSEIEIMRLAQTTVVVAVPGLGDDIQADKAGIMEIADLFVVNKADRDGASRTANDLGAMVDLGHMGKPGLNRWDSPPQGSGGRVTARVAKTHLIARYGSAEPGKISWRPPVVKTVATEDKGTEEAVGRILEHRTFLAESGRWQSRLRQDAEERVRHLVSALASRNFFDVPRSSGALERILDAVTSRQLDPYAAAEKILADATSRGPDESD